MKKTLNIIISCFRKNKEAKNASWLIGGKVIQMMISLLVGILIARYLGPTNYGVINYGTAYVAFFSSLSSLGINSIIIKNFIDHPNEEGKTIGTTFILRLISSGISCLIIFLISVIADEGEAETILVVVLCSLSLVFNVFETLNFWFQSKYLSKRVAVSTLIAYIFTSLYKIVLLIIKTNVVWFAFATSFDYIVYAIVIILYYKRDRGPGWSFSLKKAKELLSSSHHFILSGLMVAVYGYTNKLILKHLVDVTAVGYYSTANGICHMWTFVLQAIIDSMYPTIMRLYQTDRRAYERKNRQLYAIVFYASIFVSLIFTLFAPLIISILYGEEYIPAVAPMRVITWYTAFSYIGVARNAWIVCENQQKYLKFMYFGAAVINICLNFILIPLIGTVGAALASLVTELFTSIILPLMIKDMRPNSLMILQAIALKDIFNRAQRHKT